MEECREAFLPNDCPGGIDSASVIIAGVEKRVLVPALKLESSFKHFRRHIYERCGKIGEKAYMNY
jgi:hypothetical protein